MKKITIILKPTDECNFRCQYCYHADTSYCKGRMDFSLFEELLDKTFSYYNTVEIIFHGGEPLLMGFDYIKKAIETIYKKKPDKTWLRVGIQTNGYFLDEKICELCKKYNIQISVSLDGLNEYNCLRDKTEEVFNKITTLHKKGYPFNILGVVHKKNIKGYEEFYNYAKENDYHLKMNPIFKSGAAKNNESYLLDKEEYLNLLKSFYPKWIDDTHPIRRFDPFYNLTLMAVTNKGHECGQCGCLTKWVGVEHDGTLYPCGRSYTKEYSLDNIKDIDCLKDAFNHPNFRKLLEESITRRMYCSSNCDIYPVCLGGCNNDSLLSGDVSKPNDFDCYIYKEMLPFIRNYIKELLESKQKINNPDVLSMLHSLRRRKHV